MNPPAAPHSPDQAKDSPEGKPQPLAVALHYKKPGAPRVVAAGRGEIGQRIIDLARESGVPLEENAALAEALSTIELGQEIPESLYHAVAVVLRFIFKSTGFLPG